MQENAYEAAPCEIDMNRVSKHEKIQEVFDTLEFEKVAPGERGGCVPEAQDARPVT